MQGVKAPVDISQPILIHMEVGHVLELEKGFFILYFQLPLPAGFRPGKCYAIAGHEEMRIRYGESTIYATARVGGASWNEQRQCYGAYNVGTRHDSFDYAVVAEDFYLVAYPYA